MKKAVLGIIISSVAFTVSAEPISKEVALECHRKAGNIDTALSAGQKTALLAYKTGLNASEDSVDIKIDWQLAKDIAMQHELAYRLWMNASSTLKMVKQEDEEIRKTCYNISIERDLLKEICKDTDTNSWCKSFKD